MSTARALRIVTDQDAERLRAGLERLAAAVWPTPIDGVLGITDAEPDPDVVDLLAHRLNRHPETP